MNYDNEGRAPLLFISGSDDHLMPPSIQRSNAKHYNDDVITEVKQFEGPHLLPASPGWEKVADLRSTGRSSTRRCRARGERCPPEPESRTPETRVEAANSGRWS